jgi:hypothetical protein
MVVKVELSTGGVSSNKKRALRKKKKEDLGDDWQIEGMIKLTLKF